MYVDVRMPFWDLSAILSNLLLAIFSGSGQRWFYLASFSMLILFVTIYNSLVKANQSASDRNSKKSLWSNAQRWPTATGIVGWIANYARSAARYVSSCPVPHVDAPFGVNVAIAQ
jgi:hypothetical protein